MTIPRYLIFNYHYLNNLVKRNRTCSKLPTKPLRQKPLTHNGGNG